MIVRGAHLTRPAVVMVMLVITAVVTGGCAGLADHRSARLLDSRAYAVDSGRLSLDEGLRRAGLTVPDCTRDGLRYALVDNGFGYYYKVYLRLESSASCMDSFLRANDMRDLFQETVTGGASAERPLLYREAWMDSDIVRRMGWDIGPAQRFQKFSVGNSNHYSVDALVQHVPGSESLRAFVYAEHGG